MAIGQIVLRYGIIVLLVLGALIDVRLRRIPNALTLGGAALGLLANVGAHQLAGALASLEGWLVGIAILLLPFALRGIGAGDVKLLALAGAWGGPGYALYTFLYGALIGGVIALGVLLARRQLGDVLQPLARQVRWQLSFALGTAWPAGSSEVASSAPSTRQRIAFAYGPALAVGGILAMLLR